MSLTYNNYKIVIDGSEIPMWSRIHFDFEDVDYDSGRGIDGVMHRNVVQFDLHNFTLEYDLVSVEIVKQLNDLVKNKEFVTVTIYSPLNNARYTRNYYVKKSLIFENGAIDMRGGSGYISNFTVDFIERGVRTNV